MLELLIGDHVGPFLNAKQHLLDLRLHQLLLLLIFALLVLLRLHVRLQPLLVLLHVLVILVVLPRLLQLTVLVRVDVEQQQLGHHVCALLDLVQGGEPVVLDLEGVLVDELQVYLGDGLLVSG